MRNIFFILSIVSFSTFAFGFGEPKHSKVEVKASPTKTGTTFDLKVVPNSGLKITLDAPWKLVIKNEKGVSFKSTTLKKGDMSEKLPGFHVASSSAPKAGSFDYKLTSFVCTSDKTSCYREVHKGTHSWGK